MTIVQKIRSALVPALLVGGSLLLAFWLVMAERSARPAKGYALRASDISSFQPVIPGWGIRVKSIDAENPTDPNIMGLELVGESASNGSVPRFFVRLVHGYNMPMCMKIKYYTIEKIQDNRIRVVSDPKLQSAFRIGKSFSREDAKAAKEEKCLNMDVQDIQDSEANFSASKASCTSCLSMLNPSLRDSRASVQNSDSAAGVPFQLWRLTSGAGTVSLWVTTMIRAGDFGPTREDICSMAFPRVETPDDPNWVPRGFRLEDLRHPGEGFQRWWRSRWDGARWDWLTVLRLRPPARGSEELLSYITRSVVPDVTPANEAVVLQDLLATHASVLSELQQWRKKDVAPGL